LKTTPRITATGSLLLAGLAALSLTSTAGAQVTRPLTTRQVTCSADQLRSMLSRSAVMFEPWFDDRTGMFLFTYGSSSQDLSGLVVLDQSDSTGASVGPERQLAFVLTASQSSLQRNPARQQLNSLYLLRDPLSTDVVREEDPSATIVVVDTTADPAHNQDPNATLVIDNISADDAGAPASTATGKALLSLIEACPSPLTAADLHVFNVLARVVRATAFTTSGSDPKAERVHKLATLYRGASAVPISGGVRTTYRMDLYPTVQKKPLPRVSLVITIDIGNDGSLGEATLRILPACVAPGDHDCSNATSEVDVSVIKPVPSQLMWSGPSPGVCWHGAANCPDTINLSFAERLQGTTWLRPQ